MKKLLSAVIILSLSGAAFADTSSLDVNEKADPNDPCTMLFCLAGKAAGASGGSDCDSAISKFFSVNSFKKHHRFNPSETLSLRRNLIKGCSSGADLMGGVLSKFGKVRG